MPRNYLVGTKMYDIQVAALFGAICASMAEHHFVLAANGGLLERVALEQLQKNFEVQPSGHRVNDPEQVAHYVRKFCQSGVGVQEIPQDLFPVFHGFHKV